MSHRAADGHIAHSAAIERSLSRPSPPRQRHCLSPLRMSRGVRGASAVILFHKIRSFFQTFLRHYAASMFTTAMPFDTLFVMPCIEARHAYAVFHRCLPPPPPARASATPPRRRPYARLPTISPPTPRRACILSLVFEIFSEPAQRLFHHHCHSSRLTFAPVAHIISLTEPSSS